MTELTSHDCACLANLHRQALPDSTISELPAAYARSFYRYLGTSKDERVFVARNAEGKVVGGCVLSLRRATLHKRLVFRTPLLLYVGPWLLRKVWKRRPTQTKTLATAPDPLPTDMPELILIFTAAEERSRGIGLSLLRQCEEFLKSRGIREYAARTLEDPANRALHFYARNGFVACGSSTDHGRRFRVFRKVTL